MGLSSPSSQDSPPDRMFPSTSISLTLRDQNIIRAPQRTSSLKSPDVGSRVSRHPRLSQHPYKQTESLEIQYQADVLSSSAPLKIFKTRRSGGMETGDREKHRTLGHIANASSKTSTAVDMRGNAFPYGENARPIITGSDCISSRHQNLKNKGANLRLPLLAGSETDATSECSHNSRPSTSMSYVAIDLSGQNQQTQRRLSVRRAVTKAFSNLNNKRKPVLAIEKDSSQDFSQRRILSQSDTSISSSSYSHNVKPPLHDSAISITSDWWQDRSAPNLSTPCDLKPNCERPRVEVLNRHVRECSDELRVKPLSPIPSGSHAASLLESNHSPSLCRDEPPASAILRVRLAVKPELKRAEFLSEETVWAAVQIHGEIVYQTPSTTSTSSRSLAVGVILDNS
jgi:hypothetical protein